MKQFDRYEGAKDNAGDENRRRMPRASLDANTSPRCIAELISRFEDYTRDTAKFRAEYPWASRFVMGYPLPDWQRDLVWTPEQNVRFITSLWEEIDVGSYMVNDQFEFDTKTKSFRLFSDVLIDGQQRLTALQGYLLGEFAVPDAEGVPCYWHELSKVERRFFSNKIFPRATVKTWDEDLLRKAYDLRSFGGTAHKESERASRG